MVLEFIKCHHRRSNLYQRCLRRKYRLASWFCDPVAAGANNPHNSNNSVIPLTDANFQTAVNLWFSNQTDATNLQQAQMNQWTKFSEGGRVRTYPERGHGAIQHWNEFVVTEYEACLMRPYRDLDRERLVTGILDEGDVFNGCFFNQPGSNLMNSNDIFDNMDFSDGAKGANLSGTGANLSNIQFGSVDLRGDVIGVNLMQWKLAAGPDWKPRAGCELSGLEPIGRSMYGWCEFVGTMDSTILIGRIWIGIFTM